SAGVDAVGARVFRMHWRVVDRLPDGVAGRGCVRLNTAIAYGSNRPPQLVVVLGIAHRDVGVGQGCGGEGHGPRTINDSHFRPEDELTRKLVIGRWPHSQPEARGLGLLGRACGARLVAKNLDLVVISGPFLTVECGRRTRPKLRRLS